MNETAPAQKQDIDRVTSELRAIGNLLREMLDEIRWATRDDPSPTAEAKAAAPAPRGPQP